MDPANAAYAIVANIVVPADPMPGPVLTVIAEPVSYVITTTVIKFTTTVASTTVVTTTVPIPVSFAPPPDPGI